MRAMGMCSCDADSDARAFAPAPSFRPGTTAMWWTSGTWFAHAAQPCFFCRSYDFFFGNPKTQMWDSTKYNNRVAGSAMGWYWVSAIFTGPKW